MWKARPAAAPLATRTVSTTRTRRWAQLIPKGYNAFFTRGLDGWLESLKSDLQVAQEISGLERPNLVVYGGGDEIKAFCREHGLLYVTDFINAKKK